MINSLEQCITVQTKRVAASKKGYSKAVRTFVAKEHKNYREVMDSLPVHWSPAKTTEVSPVE